MPAELPTWLEPGIKPPESILEEGWPPGVKPPAQYLNWLLHQTYKCLEELQAGGAVEDVVAAVEALETTVGNFADIQTPEITNIVQAIADLRGKVSAHLTESKYKLAGGSATTITLSVANLVDGYSVTFVASANNNGSATTINGKPLYKPNTTTTPKLVAGKAYTVWYNQTSDCFFIKASAEGDVLVSHVLAGKTFSNDDDTGLVGTMPNNGAVTITPSMADQAIPAGYHNGSGKVTAVSYTAGNNDYYVDPTIHIANTFTYTEKTAVAIQFSGTLRISFDLQGDSNHAQPARAQIYKNGTAVGIERTNQTSTYIAFTEDFTVNKNDVLSLYLRSADTGRIAQVKNFRVKLNLGGAVIKQR